MKRIFTYAHLIFIILWSTSSMQAQNGLEQIIVEKYYVSNENDTSVDGDGGMLPVGSKTYRVYVDMLPDYIFQAAYGTENHELNIATTTRFFNNEDRGAITPTFNLNFMDDNTVMLDSWLSVGAACNGCIGVLKSVDDGVGTIVNGDGVLLNEDTCIGILLTAQDGHILGDAEPVTDVGISSEIEIFNSSNSSPIPTIFSTTNGAWSSLNGSMGPDPAENIVLIGQFTTDGVFSFELNIQIRNETTLVFENHVAKTPVGNELTNPTLTFTDFMEEDTTMVSTTYLDDATDVIKLYPNPSNDFITIDLNSLSVEHGSYEIYTVAGERMIYQALHASDFSKELLTIDVRQLPYGLYLLKMNLDGQFYTKKIVIF